MLSAGAVEPGLRPAAAAFQQETGHAVKIAFDTAPRIRERIGGGETFDAVIAPPAVVEEFARAGKVGTERVNLGRVGMGAAVRPGAPLPDLSSVEALKRTLIEADSVVFNRASTGLYFERLLKKMGIYAQIEGKTTRYADGAAVMDHVVKGHGKEVGFGAITEILLYRDKGLRLAGPLPAAVQNYTSYAATRMTMTTATAGGATPALLKYLGSPAGLKWFRAAGIEP